MTGSDGYFAFFTPPGQYYLQVDGKPGYQPWRSPLIEVVNEIVHVNVPYTPWTEPPVVETVTEVLLTASGPQPASITVPSGTTVQWRAEIDGLALPSVLAEQAENPALHPLSTLNPISTTLGWDGGMLQPGQIYQRQLTEPGIYTYTDGLGNQGQVCVDTCAPLAVTLASFEATAQPNAHPRHLGDGQRARQRRLQPLPCVQRRLEQRHVAGERAFAGAGQRGRVLPTATTTLPCSRGRQSGTGWRTST